MTAPRRPVHQLGTGEPTRELTVPPALAEAFAVRGPGCCSERLPAAGLVGYLDLDEPELGATGAPAAGGEARRLRSSGAVLGLALVLRFGLGPPRRNAEAAS